MKVSDLYSPDGPLVGKSVYIIGSGPSVECWRDEWLQDETCILLNDVCKYRQSWGPVAFANNKRFVKWSKCPINIVKGRLVDPKKKKEQGTVATDNHVSWDDPELYVYSYRSPFQGDAWDHFDDAALWCEPDFYWNVPGGSVSIFAIQFALLAGASRIRMVGCDCSETVKKYHTQKDEDRAGRQVKHNYKQYAAGALRMQREAWERFGVPVTFEVPWIGYGSEQKRYRDMKDWLQSA